MSLHTLLHATLPSALGATTSLPAFNTQPGPKVVPGALPVALGPPTAVSGARAHLHAAPPQPGVEPLQADNYGETEELIKRGDITRLADVPTTNDPGAMPAFAWANRAPLQLPVRKLGFREDQAAVVRQGETVGHVQDYTLEGSVPRLKTAPPTPGYQVL